MRNTTFRLAPKKLVDVYVTINGKDGKPIGEKLKENVRLTEKVKVGLELTTEEIFSQETYKSTLGLDARKSDLRNKASKMYDNVRIDIEGEVKKSAYQVQKNQNKLEKTVRMQLQSEGLTKNQLRKLNKLRKQSAK